MKKELQKQMFTVAIETPDKERDDIMDLNVMGFDDTGYLMNNNSDSKRQNNKQNNSGRKSKNNSGTKKQNSSNKKNNYGGLQLPKTREVFGNQTNFYNNCADFTNGCVNNGERSNLKKRGKAPLCDNAISDKKEKIGCNNNKNVAGKKGQNQ